MLCHPIGLSAFGSLQLNSRDSLRTRRASVLVTESAHKSSKSLTAIRTSHPVQASIKADKKIEVWSVPERLPPTIRPYSSPTLCSLLHQNPSRFWSRFRTSWGKRTFRDQMMAAAGGTVEARFQVSSTTSGHNEANSWTEKRCCFHGNGTNHHTPPQVTGLGSKFLFLQKAAAALAPDWLLLINLLIRDEASPAFISRGN